jgi:NADH:ubiquinone oxidoreductase subunit 5 (subunit L)/multisubunit Na+/H+ antiporter MnhA subunit
MIAFFEFFVLLPLFGFLISLVLPEKNETLLSRWSFVIIGIHMITFQAFLIYWLVQGHPASDFKDLVLYSSPDYEFFIDFYFDSITAVYLFVGSILTFLVTVYSRYYLHREVGYKPRLRIRELKGEGD